MRSEYRFLLALGLSAVVVACGGDDKPAKQGDPMGDGADGDGANDGADGTGDDDTDGNDGDGSDPIDGGSGDDGSNPIDGGAGDDGPADGGTDGDGDDGDGNPTEEEPGANCAKVTQPAKLVNDLELMFLTPRLGGQHVYFADDDTIQRVPKCGGDTETILTAMDLRAFDVHDGHIYFVDAEGLRKAPAEPGASATMIAEAGNTTAIDARTEGVFWAEANLGGATIHGAGLDGSGAAKLSESEGTAAELIADATHVYWLALSSTIFRAALDGSSQTPTTVLQLPGGTESASDHFALDATQVYLTDDLNNESTSLWRAPKDGTNPEGTPLAYVFGGNPSAVVAASGVVYFATRNSTSNIYSIAPDATFGTMPTKIGSSERIANLVVDAQDLFMRMDDQPWDIERLSR